MAFANRSALAYKLILTYFMILKLNLNYCEAEKNVQPRDCTNMSEVRVYTSDHQETLARKTLMSCGVIHVKRVASQVANSIRKPSDLEQVQLITRSAVSLVHSVLLRTKVYPDKP